MPETQKTPPPLLPESLERIPKGKLEFHPPVNPEGDVRVNFQLDEHPDFGALDVDREGDIITITDPHRRRIQVEVLQPNPTTGQPESRKAFKEPVDALRLIRTDNNGEWQLDMPQPNDIADRRAVKLFLGTVAQHAAQDDAKQRTAA